MQCLAIKGVACTRARRALRLWLRCSRILSKKLQSAAGKGYDRGVVGVPAHMCAASGNALAVTLASWCARQTLWWRVAAHHPLNH